MKDKKIKNLINILRNNIKKYNDEYYNNDNSLITDYEFDSDLRSLEYLENYNYNSDNSPIKKIGGEKDNFITPVIHRYKMYSLQKIYNYKDMIYWENSIKKYFKDIEYICEYKYDGVSINLIYKNGNLIKAATRGDGIKGEDVTYNIKTISSIPLKLKNKYPDYLEVRGEIIIPLEFFNKINLKRSNEGKKIYSNSRNLASGSLKLKNINEVYKRSLDCLIYSLHSEKLPFNSQYESLKFAESIGFKVYNFYKVCNSLKEVFNFIKKYEFIRYKLPYQIDGIVVKINNLYQQKIIGFTNKYPRWAVAYKYNTNSFKTKLLDIKFQIGRTGVITPVAKFNPVFINGTIIKKASLHNFNYIKKLGIYYEDIIYVEKGGEIIPKIKYIDIEKRNINAHSVIIINKCPCCNTNLIKKNSQKLLFCPNEESCSSQIIKKLEHFVSRDAMNIPYLGKKTIKYLFNKKLILNISDFYLLDYNIIRKNIDNKLIKKILNGIEQSKNVYFDRFLYALSIRYIGLNIAKKLAIHFNTIDLLINNINNNSIKINNIGNKIINSLKIFFSKEKNINSIYKLKKLGIKILNINDFSKFHRTLEGKTFLFTGKLSSMTRKEAEILISYKGGKILKTVTSNLDYLIIGNKFGSKFRKAIILGTVKILSEEEFRNIVNIKN